MPCGKGSGLQHGRLSSQPILRGGENRGQGTTQHQQLKFMCSPCTANPTPIPPRETEIEGHWSSPECEASYRLTVTQWSAVPTWAGACLTRALREGHRCPNNRDNGDWAFSPH
ncbi:hypothetical protein DPEC_G00264020 [Dallia pectoralis]|uniref:Uncharacterized protein n=1 Tax=Dallia pectoralis TaxID=75939 RepID=A0ACC2FSG1_DALPE|nr:hypothetical protein DPEC_G00264020 [Dallia pectoralis]